MIKLRLIICFIFLLTGLCHAQDEYIDSLIHLSRSTGSADSLDINQLSTWQKAFNESKESGSNYRMEEICAALGDFFFDYGLYTDAIKYYAHIFSTSIDTVNKSDGLIDIYRKIGQSYSHLGLPDSAFYFYRRIFNEFDFPEKLEVLRDLVDIYANNTDHQKSLEYNLLIEDLLISHNAPAKELSKIYNNIGYNYHRLRQYGNGILYFNRALTISPSLTDEEESAILRNLGISHYNLGNYNRSIELLNQSYIQTNQAGERTEIAHLIATVHVTNGDYFRAISYFEKAEELAKSANQDELLSDIYAGYAIVYNATHEYDLAFEYFKNHSRLRDSLKFVEQLDQKRILDNQKYIERTEKENRFLKARQDLQKLQIAQLETQARNQALRNNALTNDSIRRANELSIAIQKNEIAQATEENNLLVIARQKNLIRLTNQRLEIAQVNEENAAIEREKQQKEIELAQQTISLQLSDAQLKDEKDANEVNAREIEKRKTSQRNIAIIAALLAGLALLMVWAYRNKRRDNSRITKAYEILSIAQDQLKAAEARIKGLLKQQVPGAVADTLISNIDTSAVQQRFVCIMFLDIRDFSSFCEGRKPSEIISYQNSVFGFMIDIIEKHHGIVNQLMGDGFMATFGAPISEGNDCLNAYQAAHKIIKTLTTKVDKGELAPTKVGIGLHAGNVVTGNVGNEDRKQFSITGNTVIIAARLEQLNKQFKSTLVYSKELYDALPEKERIPGTFQSVMVKGRSKPIEVAML